jgi:hypothetical protein
MAVPREPQSKSHSFRCGFFVVGLVGLEPTTLCSQSRCASQLRYSPMSPSILDEIIKKEKTPIQYVGSGSE